MGLLAFRGKITVEWAFASKTNMNYELEQPWETSNYVMVDTVSAKNNVWPDFRVLITAILFGKILY